MTAPLVALTASPVAASRVRHARWGMLASNDTYVAALRAAGVRPVLVPVGDDLDDPAALVEPFAGVVLPGGGDIDPVRYGAARHPATYGVDPARDALEEALVVGARQLGRPVLAICRGIQVVNVVAGGDLIQHVPDVATGVVHGAPAGDPAPEHPVTLEPGSRLAAAVGATLVEHATSLHHQAVGRLGEGLVVTGRGPDRLVEAVESPIDEPWWLVAVQWHPEATAAGDPAQAALFSAFARECRNFVPPGR